MFRYFYLLAFGSNLGERHAHLERGVVSLASHGKFVRQTAWSETPPLPSNEFDTSDHQSYVNFVAEYSTELSPLELYALITKVEDVVGHNRERKWAPRELDIDILFASVSRAAFANGAPLRLQRVEGLVVPHPGFWRRSFLTEMVIDELKIELPVLERHCETIEDRGEHD